MPDKLLSAKRRHFCREYHANGHNGAQAYKTAYPNAKSGYSAHAARLIVKDSVQRELRRLEAMTVVRGDYDVDACDEQYSDIIDLAIDLKQPSAAVSAITGRARLRGWDKDHVVKDDAPEPLSDTELAIARDQAQRVTRLKLA